MEMNRFLALHVSLLCSVLCFYLIMEHFEFLESDPLVDSPTV